MSRFRDDKHKSDGEKVASSEKEVEREMSGRRKMPRQTAGSRNICQDSKVTSASQIKRQWQHETKMSRARNAKHKDFREISQSTAVPARRSGKGSPLSLKTRFFPLSKLPSPELPGLYFFAFPQTRMTT